jgi:peptide-methionine (R)-S-oxide reductase
MSRRGFLSGLAGSGLLASSIANAKSVSNVDSGSIPDFAKWQLSEAEWKKRLTPEQFRILRKSGTERAGSSPLDKEGRNGTFVCAACALPLFASTMKYDSGTGWPSFYDHLPNAIITKPDNSLWMKRTEYHCARCGGHQGHVFEDGPRDKTGLRYCNNGVALKFIPAAS